MLKYESFHHHEREIDMAIKQVDTPKIQFHRLLNNILREIEQIEYERPSGSSIPFWFDDMMDLKRKVRILLSSTGVKF